ncbi:hypothetical protein GQ54DRAFT_296677 [Martensiomyces pterosporus]|nr:hypothetical protein GQ54DRAFT_296677 [Martensiomyces pterosporus]
MCACGSPSSLFSALPPACALLNPAAEQLAVTLPQLQGCSLQLHVILPEGPVFLPMRQHHNTKTLCSPLFENNNCAD